MTWSTKCNADGYDEIQSILNVYYPKSPFIIHCVRNIKQLLYEPFSYKEYIIICDNMELMRKKQLGGVRTITTRTIQTLFSYKMY